AQAVDAAVAPREVGRPQPRLVTAGADRPEIDVRLVHAAPLRRSRATKNPSVPSRDGSVSRNEGTDGCCQTGAAERRSSVSKSVYSVRKAAISRSFSLGEIVQ